MNNLTDLKPQIAIVHTGHRWLGGGEAVAIWTIEALKDLYDLTVIAFSDMDLQDINRFFGSHLKERDFTFIKIPSLGLTTLSAGSFWHLRRHWAMRYFKRMAHRYDLAISTYYEMDFGRPGIQYVHSPSFAASELPGLDDHIAREQQSLVKRLYRKSSSLMSGYELYNVKRNKTLVNSRWTKQIIDDAYSISAELVYPPVLNDFPNLSWQDKENGFVCIGRMARGKRFKDVIQILQAVRSLGHDVQLHLIYRDIRDAEYHDEIVEFQRSNDSWLFLHRGLDREELTSLVARNKYGIHGMRNEHFGIAVAEMVKAGNIPFVPDDGGQVEIVGNEQLIYHSHEDAVQKIVNVLQNERLQGDIRRELASRSELFSTDHFMKRMRGVVSEML